MGALISLITGLASGETAYALKRARIAAISYGLAAIAALCGVGFLIGALYVWAARHYGSLETSVGFGVGFLLLAGLIVLIFRLGARSRARRIKTRRSADMTALGMTALAAVLPALARSKAGPGLILGPAAAVLAYVIYRENTAPRRRRPDPDAERD